MNLFKMSVIALASAIALTGCGGSKSSSSSNNKKDKKPESGESRDPQLTPAKLVYTSPTCMDDTDIKNANIDLTGVKLINTCLNKDSKKGHLVLEAAVKEPFEFRINRYEHEKAVAEMFFETRSKQIVTIMTAPGISIREKMEYISALTNEDLPKTIELINKMKYLESFHVRHKIQQGATYSSSDSMDFSIKAKVYKVGITKITRDLHANDPKMDKLMIENAIKTAKAERGRDITKQEVREAANLIHNPRGAEEISFLIKERKTEKK